MALAVLWSCSDGGSYLLDKAITGCGVPHRSGHGAQRKGFNITLSNAPDACILQSVTEGILSPGRFGDDLCLLDGHNNQMTRSHHKPVGENTDVIPSGGSAVLRL